jgi:tetratricopeptide (TPR) repeat protein
LHEQLVSRLKPHRRKQEEAVQREIQQFLKTHPELEKLVPLLLDRGDPHGRSWALAVAQLGKTPALQQALRDFALSQRGPDDQRMTAARAAMRAGLLTSPARLWTEGEWTEIELLDFEVSFEPDSKHPPAVVKLSEQAHDALTVGDGVKAEKLLREALALAPDAPDLLNNLAAAYGLQGRRGESHALIREVHARFPDYWFGTIGATQLLIDEGKLDEAEKLLKPLRQQSKLHFSEFVALAMAMIDLLLARRKYEGAKSWLKMWEDIVPDHFALDRYRERIRRSSSWGGWLPWRR